MDSGISSDGAGGVRTFVGDLVAREVEVDERQAHEVLAEHADAVAAQLAAAHVEVRQEGRLDDEALQFAHAAHAQRVAAQVQHLYVSIYTYVTTDTSTTATSSDTCHDTTGQHHTQHHNDARITGPREVTFAQQAFSKLIQLLCKHAKLT